MKGNIMINTQLRKHLEDNILVIIMIINYQLIIKIVDKK